MEKNEEVFCPVAFTVSILHGKWKLLILSKLLEGTKRFKELEREVTGITSRMLIHELKELEEKKIIRRKVYPEVPPRVEYSINESAISLKDIVESIQHWGMQHYQNNFIAPSQGENKEGC